MGLGNGRSEQLMMRVAAAGAEALWPWSRPSLPFLDVWARSGGDHPAVAAVGESRSAGVVGLRLRSGARSRSGCALFRGSTLCGARAPARDCAFDDRPVLRVHIFELVGGRVLACGDEQRVMFVQHQRLGGDRTGAAVASYTQLRQRWPKVALRFGVIVTATPAGRVAVRATKSMGKSSIVKTASIDRLNGPGLMRAT